VNEIVGVWKKINHVVTSQEITAMVESEWKLTIDELILKYATEDNEEIGVITEEKES
jgi:hypothetical protein